MKAKKFHVAMAAILTFALILFSLAISSSLWVWLIWWLGPWKTLLATVFSTISISIVVGWGRARKEKWVPENAAFMAQGLVQKWGYTVEEGWEIVGLMEDILRSEHSPEQAYTMVKIITKRTDKDRTLAILRNLASESPGRNHPAAFPKVLTT